MTGTFLTRFALYAISAIAVSFLAFTVLTFSEKRLKSSAAFLLATLLLVRIFIPMGVFGISVITLGEKSPVIEQTPQDTPSLTPSLPNDTPSFDDTVPSPLPPIETSEPFWENEVYNTVGIAIVFGVSALSLGLYLSADTITKRRLKRSATRVVDPELLSLYTQLAEDRHLDRVPALYASPYVTSPCLVGFISPRIYLPTDAKNDTAALSMLLTHELEHHRTGDLYVKFFALSIISFQWWNPFLRPLVKKLDLYLEQACDERVLKDTTEEEVLAYSALMLSLCKKALKKRRADERLTAYFSKTAGKDLKCRMARLLDGKPRSRGVFLILSVVLIAISSLFLVGFAPLPPSEELTPPAITTNAPSTEDDLYFPTEHPDSLKPAEKEGYTFSHWESFISENGEEMLKAIYTPNAYTLTLHANGGRVDAPTLLTFGTKLPVPTREGFTFGGWYTDVALTDPIATVPSYDATLYAYWKEETPTSLFDYELYHDHVTVTGCRFAGSVVMPSYIGGRPVWEIGKYAFEGSALTDIVLPTSLRHIGVGAFYNCRALTTVTLYRGVGYIDRVAFDACYSLTAIYYDGDEESWRQIDGKSEALPVYYR